MRLPIHLAWLFFVFLVSFAFDPETELPPKGPLQVRLDYGLARRPDGTNEEHGDHKRNVVFTSVLEFARPVNDIRDGQLVQICLDAYDEMMAEISQYHIPKTSRPKVMTVLAIGKFVILASSQRGPIVFTNQNSQSPVSLSLSECQLAFAKERNEEPGDHDHMYERKCGEVMSAHLWYRIMEQMENPQASMKGHGGRIVSVSKYRALVNIVRPCGKPEENSWGCDLFISDQGIREIDRLTPAEPYNVGILTDGSVSIKNMPLCQL